MKNAILALSALLILNFSCKKSSDPAPIPSEAGPFMNIVAGSSWNYETVDSNKSPITTKLYTLTSSSNDTLIDGRSYHIYTNTNGNTREYYNITGSDYFTFRALDALLGGSKVVNLYLKDNAGVGASWSQTYTGLTIPGLDGATVDITTTNTIRGINLNKSVKGNNYTNVIDVETTLAATAFLSGFPIVIPPSSLKTNIHFYYAPNYGLIQSDNYIKLDYQPYITDSVKTYTKLVSAVLN